MLQALPPPQASPRLSGAWGARETSEKRERGMMGTSVEREREVITPFVLAFLNYLLKYPPEIASDLGQGS